MPVRRGPTLGDALIVLIALAPALLLLVMG
jgi:hypothetical protein